MNDENSKNFSLIRLTVLSTLFSVVSICCLLFFYSVIDKNDTSENNDSFNAPSDLAEVIAQVENSIIAVECDGSSGTGWSLSTEAGNLIVTNHHVIENCLGGYGLVGINTGTTKQFMKYWAIVGSDEESDLAVIKGPPDIPGLKTNRPPPVGSWLMVIGNPLGLKNSVNYGTLTNLKNGTLYTDAAVNPGNSGGPVFNSKGQVIGIATAKLIDEGIDRIGIVVPLADLCKKILGCEEGQWE